MQVKKQLNVQNDPFQNNIILLNYDYWGINVFIIAHFDTNFLIFNAKKKNGLLNN